MKITLQAGLLLAVFGIGVLTGRNTAGSGDVEAGAARVASFQRLGDFGDDESVALRGASEAEERFLAKVKTFEKGGAKRWAEEQFADVLNGFDEFNDRVEFLKELTFLDAEMLREAAGAWLGERMRLSVTEENVEWHSWISLLESDLYQQWAKVAPQEALAYLLAQPDEIKNHYAVGAVFGMMYKKDPSAVMTELEKLSGGARQAAMRGVYERMAIHHPEDALEAAVSGFGKGDKTEAAILSSVVEDAATRLVKRDPKRAMELAAKLAESPEGERALKAAADTWAEKDAAAAEVWLRENNSAGRNEALSLLLRKRLDSDFEQIAKDFPSLIAGSEIRDETISLSAKLVMSQMERRSLEEAAEWTKQLPEGRIRDVSQMIVAQKWVETDTLKASEWIRQMPPSLQRDASTEKLVQAIQHSDPAAALEWAKVIAEPKMKQKTVDRILKAWQETDPAAAAQAVLEK